MPSTELASFGISSETGIIWPQLPVPTFLAFHFTARIEPGVWAWEANSQLLGSTPGLTVQTSF